MISFLAPFALAGLAALAVPVVIHLLKPRRVRIVPFSSLRWLRASQHRFSRRIQWHQILLFLLRAGFLLLLVMAAARPVWQRRGGGGSAHRFVVVDASRSMGTAFRDHADPMTTARGIADRLVAQAGPGRQTAVLVSGHAPRALTPLSSAPGQNLERVRNLAAEGIEAPVTSALGLVPPLRRGAVPADAVELVLREPQQGNCAEAEGDRELGTLGCGAGQQGGGENQIERATWQKWREQSHGGCAAVCRKLACLESGAGGEAGQNGWARDFFVQIECHDEQHQNEHPRQQDGW